MARASARHLLVPDEATCNELKARIEKGEDFAALAKEYSKCPSGRQGGDLGEFGRGQICLLYTSPSPRDRQKSRMPSSA